MEEGGTVLHSDGLLGQATRSASVWCSANVLCFGTVGPGQGWRGLPGCGLLPHLAEGLVEQGRLPLTLQLLVDAALPFPCKLLRLAAPVSELQLPLLSRRSSSANLPSPPSLSLKTLAAATCFSFPLRAHS